jgi:hypothetical protein
MSNEPFLKGIEIVTTQAPPANPWPLLKGIQIVTTQANPLTPWPLLKAIHIVTQPLQTTLLAGTYKQATFNS